MEDGETGPRRSGAAQEISDEALDGHILARLGLLGVDLTVLPEDDPGAPVDQRRVLASARRFLRTTPGAIADFPLDAQEAPPEMYPATLHRPGAAEP